MSGIRAFVAHSFGSNDKQVVDTFLTFFRQLSDDEKFSWEHAEAAQPKALAEKVMSLLSDKDTLIAICTKEERVVRHTVVANAFLRRFRFVNVEYAWKTSDWIMQEISVYPLQRLS
jgi:hypothetical protein